MHPKSAFLLLSMAAAVSAAAVKENKGLHLNRHVITFDNDNIDLPAAASKKIFKKTRKFALAENLSDADVAALGKLKGIKIMKDAEVKIAGTQQNPPNWGLDRIDQTNLPRNSQYTYPDAAGAGVTVYVIDTGIHTSHVEFSGRASFAVNFQGDGIDEDCNGHGTHVASTIGGESVGVAKDVTLKAVKVLGCDGRGAMSSIMAGIQYVIDQHNASPNKKTIINMSLGGGRFPPVDDVVKAATDAGIIVVVAAGNNAEDACSTSPAAAPSAITVAAADLDDTRAGFSNYGSCVDLYGPGVDIFGAWYTANNDYSHLSGTSQATPHVAGVAALYQSTGQALTPSEITSKLIADSTKDVIKANVGTTPNRLLFLSNPTIPQPPTLQCAYTIPAFDGVNKYCVLAAKSKSDAVAACTQMNGNLADIQTVGEFAYLASKVAAKSWVRSWQGDSYGDACLVFWPGGAITQAACGEMNQGLCEVRQ